MTPGFLVEHVGMPATPEAQMWVAGKPSRGLFGLKGPLIAYELQSFRCERCGMLESYCSARSPGGRTAWALTINRTTQPVLTLRR